MKRSIASDDCGNELQVIECDSGSEFEDIMDELAVLEKRGEIRFHKMHALKDITTIYYYKNKYTTRDLEKKTTILV